MCFLGYTFHEHTQVCIFFLSRYSCRFDLLHPSLVTPPRLCAEFSVRERVSICRPPSILKTIARVVGENTSRASTQCCGPLMGKQFNIYQGALIFHKLQNSCDRVRCHVLYLAPRSFSFYCRCAYVKYLFSCRTSTYDFEKRVDTPCIYIWLEFLFLPVQNEPGMLGPLHEFGGFDSVSFFSRIALWCVLVRTHFPDRRRVL